MLNKTFTVYKVNLDNSLSHKEHLNNLDELNEWMGNVYNKFPTVLVICDQTNVKITLTDNGEWFEQIKKEK